MTHPVVRPVLGVFAVTTLLGLAAVLAWGRTPDPWVTTHLAMTYEIGFIPRGLWGTVLDSVGIMPSAPTAAALLTHGIVVVSVAGAVAAGLPTVRSGRGRRPTRRAVVVGALLASPAGFPFLAAEMGRLDAVLVSLTIAAVAVAHLPGRAVPLLVAAVVALAGLVHEAAALVTAPLATAVVARRHGRPAAGMTLALGVLPIAALVVRPMPVTQPELAAWLATRIDRVDPFATLLPYQDLPTAVTRAWRHLTGPGIGQLAGIAVSVTPTVALVVRALQRRDDDDRAWLVVAALAPLGLALVGTDLTRWAALAVLGLGGVAAALTPPGEAATGTDGFLAILTCVATLLVGPLAA